ncbi:MAG TPA: SRPBCC family protein [Acidimicrobiia bacterium]|nr:SRPBCC family protein [Acidimicrobiia bacterium]
MEINDSFRVSTPIAQTWDVLLDIERIAPCLPGAQLQEIEGDEYRGLVKVKVGPITAQYKGSAHLTEVDEANRRVVIAASGRDTRGQGNASATITVTMADDDGGTRVAIDTDLTITGKVAQFARGTLAEVSSKLLHTFVENLERDVLAAGADAGTGGDDEPESEPVPDAAPEPPVATAAPAPAAVRRIDSAEAAPVDLLGVAGAPVAKRAVPAVVGLLVLFVLWRLLRRRR